MTNPESNTINVKRRERESLVYLTARKKEGCKELARPERKSLPFNRNCKKRRVQDQTNQLKHSSQIVLPAVTYENDNVANIGAMEAKS